MRYQNYGDAPIIHSRLALHDMQRHYELQDSQMNDPICCQKLMYTELLVLN